MSGEERKGSFTPSAEGVMLAKILNSPEFILDVFIAVIKHEIVKYIENVDESDKIVPI